MSALPGVRTRIAGFVFLLGLTALFGMTFRMSNQVYAQTAPSLGTAASFAVLGGSTVTNTGPSVVNGDLGVSPGNAITGFPPGIVTPPGAIHAADAVALQAQSDVTTAYNDLAGQTPCTDMTGQDLGGLTLTEGIYCFSSSAQLTGALTLNAQGNAAAVFIFQIASTLTTASNSSVLVENGGTGCNVWWQVGSSATLGTTTAFQGNILALESITLTTGANLLPGRALARNGAVTMDTNNIGVVTCAVAPTFTPTNTDTPTATVPPVATAVPTSAPPGPTAVPPVATAVPSPTEASAGGSQAVSGLPDTGGGPPQPTYWTVEPRR